MGHVLGYARDLHRAEQVAALQHDELTAAGCVRIWTDTASGATTSRPQLDNLLSCVLAGDTVVVWRLDRLGRSLSHCSPSSKTSRSVASGFRSLR